MIYRLLHILLVFSVISLICTGCDSYGPTLPIESVQDISSEKLRANIESLYKKNSEDVCRAMGEIAEMRENGATANPYLASMLTDKRIAKMKHYSLVSYKPIFKEAAITIAMTGEQGVKTLLDQLEATSETQGINDDFIREAVSEGLKAAIKNYGKEVFISLNNTTRVRYVMNAVNVCRTLEPSPGRWSDSDPRRNLKLYKHFGDISKREGLKTYIEVLGLIGDNAAIALLDSIAPLTTVKTTHVIIDDFNTFQRKAVVSQFRIRPVRANRINPEVKRNLFIDLIADGESDSVAKLLEEGISPDYKTLNDEPALSFAYKKGQGLFDLLVNKGADLNCRLSKNDTMLIRAAREGNAEFVIALVRNGGKVDFTNNAKETPVIAAYKAFIDVWNGKKNDADAEGYFNILSFLNTNGSPRLPKKMLKTLSKKEFSIFQKKTGITMPSS